MNIISKFTKNNSPELVPPDPKSRYPLPFGAGHLVELLRDPLTFLEKAVQADAEAGVRPLSYIKIGPLKIYLLNDPELVREVLVTSNKSFDKSKNVRWLKQFMGEGLVTSEGDFHLHQRRLIQPLFYRQHLETYAPLITDYARRLQETWQDGQELDMERQMQTLTRTIITRILFSTSLEEETQLDSSVINLDTALQAIEEWSGRGLLPLPLAELLDRLPLPLSRRFKQARTYLDRQIYELIRQRKAAAGNYHDLLSLLVTPPATDSAENGCPLSKTAEMSEKQIRDEALTLFMAGHGTTALALSWCWYLLARHPHIQRRVQAEIDRMLAGKEKVEVADLEKLEYTSNVVRETLRLYPPAYVIIRSAKTELKLGGYTIPPRAFVIPSPYLLGRNPAYFPQPLEFQPERWTAEFKAALPRYAYLPFGAGPRVCMGEPLAWLEITLALVTLARQWEVRLADETGQDRAREVKPRPLLTLRFKNGLPLILTRRDETHYPPTEISSSALTSGELS